MRPKILSVVEAHRAGRVLATVSLEIDMIDLERLLAPCDLSAVEGSGALEKARDSAAALAKIREAELAAAPPAYNEAVKDSKAKSGQDLIDHVVSRRVANEEQGL